MQPKNYEEWKHCITVNCGIALTTSYLQKRLDELQDEAYENTKQFARLYGQEYQQQIIAWFSRALSEQIKKH